MQHSASYAGAFDVSHVAPDEPQEQQQDVADLFRMPDALVRVLSDPAILLAGVGIGGDVRRLEREYKQLQHSGVKGIVDLSELAKRKLRRSSCDPIQPLTFEIRTY